MVPGDGREEPLARFPAMRTGDVAEAEHVVADAYVPHRLHAAGRLDARLNVARSGGITIGYLRYGADARLSVPPMLDVYHVNLTLSGGTTVQQGPMEARTAAQRSGAMISPDRPSTVVWSADAGQFAVKIDRRALEAQLSALLHDAVNRPLRFALAVDLARPGGAALLSATKFMATQVELLAPGDDLVRQHMESFILTQVLLGVPNNYRDRLTATAGPIPRSALDEVLDYIEAHPRRPLALAELAAVAGTSAAALSTAFRQELGTTPLEYVRGARLAGAQAELRSGDPAGGPLQALARRWGFADDRQFTAAYAARYGEDPGAVLHSARSGRAARRAE